MKINKYEVVTFTELGYDTPGGNYIIRGNNSGEEYFDEFFKDKLHDAMKNEYKIRFTASNVFGLPMVYFRTIIELSIELYGLSLIEKYIDIDNSDISNDRKNDFKQILDFYSSKEIGYKHPDNLKYVKRYNR